MPAKPMEREYRMMAAPLAVSDMDFEIHRDESGVELMIPLNAFNSECYVEGYATTFNDPYVLWEDPDTGWRYVEVMDRDALLGADVSDVILLYDHEGRVYARNRNDTLRLATDEHGLRVMADLSKTTLARQMYEDVKAGMVDKMSWAFTIEDEKVEEDELNRTTTFTIQRIRKIFDVSIVSRPADPNTEISARRTIDGAIEGRKLREAQQAERELLRKRKELALRARAMSIE